MSLEKDLEKKFGEGVVYKAGNAPILDVEVTPTGSLALDVALGVGGFPRGRIIEVFGREMAGKTSLAQHAIAEAQKIGIECAFIDMEHAIDFRYMEACGVDIDELYFSQPDDGETALEIVEAIVRSGDVGLVVVDSIASLVPRAEIQGEMGQSFIGLQARLMSQALRKMSGAVKKNNCSVLFTNQLRTNINATGWGPKEVQPGGRAMKYWASIRLDLRKIQTLKDKGDAIASRIRCKVKKNKVAPPFTEAEFDIEYGRGISREGELIDLGEEVGIIEKRGSWYSCGEESIQGKENFKEWLRNHQEEADEIEKTIRAHYGLVQEEKDG